MAPEQLTTGLVDRRADVYSAGVMLWEGLTGRRLFNPKAIPDGQVLVARIMAGQIDPPSAIVPSTPKALDEVVSKALSPSRADRFETARDMAVALGRGVPSRQPTGWGVGGPGRRLRAPGARRGAERDRARRVAETGRFVRLPRLAGEPGRDRRKQ
jgi:hypothetical protein